MSLAKDIVKDVATGVLVGLIVGDEKYQFPIDMVAIPAFQAHMITGTPSMQVYIKAGETLMPTGGNVADMQENMDIEPATMAEKPKKRKLSAWNKYTAKKANKIYKKDGKLDFKKMSKAFKASKDKTKPKRRRK